jgi:protein-S-isoprenylcysteine O-methyltransferase Ste14
MAEACPSRGVPVPADGGSGVQVPADGGSGVQGTVDAGRVVMVVLFTLSMISCGGRVWVAARSGVPAGRAVLEVACGVVTAVFCALVVTAYLRRGPACATDRRPGIWLVAPAATCLPLVIPALPVRPGGTGRSLLAFALILTGTAWAVWSVRHLSTCLSVVPQARQLVDTGPYRLVRHPLYLGEMVTVTGFAVRGGHWLHWVVVAALVVLQTYRAVHEETLLAVQVPGYADYAARTWRLLPVPWR